MVSGGEVNQGPQSLAESPPILEGKLGSLVRDNFHGTAAQAKHVGNQVDGLGKIVNYTKYGGVIFQRGGSPVNKIQVNVGQEAMSHWEGLKESHSGPLR